MFRVDHIAFRVANRHKAVEFFQKALGYKLQKMPDGSDEFTIDFGDGETVKCYALEPSVKTKESPWLFNALFGDYVQEYHMPFEIFVSDGTPDSIVGKWVAERGGIGGIHHIAYQVDSVEDTMKEWIEKGYAEFSSDKPFHCENLTQIFTRPSVLCGVIFEFIERKEYGFCAENVKNLMISTLDKNMK